MALAKITQVTGRAVSVPGNDIDTDRIIPARFMKCVTFDGLGEFLFHDVRKNADGADLPHPLNDPRFKGATILLSGANFGCGSSREHAPWALDNYGIRCIIAPSFADIFYNNCFNNGMLPIVLPTDVVDGLFPEVRALDGYSLEIDLPSQTITKPNGEKLSFELNSFLKERLLNGWDQIGLTLLHDEAISAYEKKRGIA